MLPSPAPLPPPPAPAAAVETLSGRVECTGCPDGPVYVQAWDATDRYRWPWWNVYGFLAAFHKPAELDAIRPRPLATVRLDGPGPFRIEVPRGREVHLFARLDTAGSGPDRGPGASDWVGRFPRNPVVTGENAPPLDLILYPLAWSEDFERVRYRSPAAPDGAPRFVDATAGSGAAFRHCQGGDIGQLPVVVGSGALLEDLDGDGDLDLFAVQGLGDCPDAAPTSQLFENDGRGHFRNVTAGSGLDLAATGMGVVGGDHDADGDIDLFVTTYQGSHLFRNEGRLRFHDVTEQAGVFATGRWPVSAAFGDVDGDGRLDLFVANYVTFSTRPPFRPDAEIPAFVTPMLSSPFAFPAEADQLFRNEGQGRFRELAGALGAADPEGKGMASLLGDVDLDGDLDLFVSNDCSKSRLFENRAGSFHDVSRRAGVDDHSSGMGIAFGDADGDGRPDLFVPHWLNEPSVFFANLSSPAAPRFVERTIEAGLAPAGNGLTGWAASFLDADLDGDLDLFVANGHTHPGSDAKTLEAQPLQLFANDGRGRFRDVSAASGQALLAPVVYRGAAFGDVDGDGDQDAWVVAWNGAGRLLRNETRGRRWLKLRLTRATGERGAIGARVELRAGGRTQVREVASGTGYLSHSALEVTFGLAGAERVDSLVVTWPGGRRESFAVPAVDRAIELREGGGEPVAR